MNDTLKKKRFRTFLSFSSEESGYAKKLAKILSERNDIKLVQGNIRDAQKWNSKLVRELRSSDLFVALLSPSSVKSAWILQELGAAWGACKAIVPIKTRPNVQLPRSLDGLISFEMDEVLTPENWSRILSAFEGVRDGNWFNFLTEHPLR